MAGSFDCRMRYKVPNLQSIYLLKMCCNPFTHFLIAGEARSADVVPFLQSCLSWPFWLPRMRHEVPNWWPRCAILPSITLLIAEDEAWSAEFMPILAIPPLICPFWLLSEAHAECRIGSGYTVFIPFFMYSPEPFCLPDLFPAYHLVTRMRQTYLSLSYI
jgi:hypothetical protein